VSGARAAARCQFRPCRFRAAPSRSLFDIGRGRARGRPRFGSRTVGWNRGQPRVPPYLCRRGRGAGRSHPVSLNEAPDGFFRSPHFSKAFSRAFRRPGTKDLNASESDRGRRSNRGIPRPDRHRWDFRGSTLLDRPSNPIVHFFGALFSACSTARCPYIISSKQPHSCREHLEKFRPQGDGLQAAGRRRRPKATGSHGSFLRCNLTIAGICVILICGLGLRSSSHSGFPKPARPEGHRPQVRAPSPAVVFL